MGKSIGKLEQGLIAAKGDPKRHAKARKEIRKAGLPQLADELDRIARDEK